MFIAETYVSHISYIFIAVIVYENESITRTHFIEKTNHNFNEKEDLITEKAEADSTVTSSGSEILVVAVYIFANYRTF